MNTVKSVLGALAAFFGGVAFAADICVPTHQPTLADAIAAARDGDTIYLEDGGTYSCGATIQKGVTIDGGGTATISAANTLTINHADAVLTGLTLTKVKSNAAGYKLQSGTIRDCTIQNCENQSSEILIALDMSGGLLEDCVVRDNKGGNGSGTNKREGVVKISGNSTVRNVLFCGNSTFLGAGAYNHTVAGAGCAYVCPVKGAMVTFENCTFANNTGSYVGGLAVGRPDASCAGSVVLRNCVLAGNTSPYDFKDIGVDANCSKDLTVYLGGTGRLAFENTFAGTVPTTVAAQEGLTVGAVGFVDERGGDFKLLPGSPAYGFGARAQSRGDDFAVAVKVPENDRAVGELAVTLDAQLFNAPSGAATYVWDLDGDGSYETTGKGASFEHVFTTPGWHKVGVRATVGGETAEQPAANLVYVAPTRIYLRAKGSNAFPYDTEAKAAASASAAAAAALSGSMIDIMGVCAGDVKVSGVALVGHGIAESALKLSKVHFYNNVTVQDLTLQSVGGNTPTPIYTGSSSVSLRNCRIEGFAYTTGGTTGGLYEGVTIDGCTFANCRCNGGSGIFEFSGDSAVRNSVFTGNYFANGQQDHFGAIYLTGSDVLFENNTVYGNYESAQATGGKVEIGAGIYVPSGRPVIRNTIVLDNVSGIVASETAKPTLESNFTEGDPCFADAAKGDFTLLENSPCVDAGVYSAAQAGRFRGYALDIGAYERETPTPHLVVTPSETECLGAQEVTFTAASDSAVPMKPKTTYLWTVNGVERPETGDTLVRMMESGTNVVTAASRECAYFTAATNVVVKALPGVDFSGVETAYVGRKTVSLMPFATGSFVVSDAATFAWYVNDSEGARTPTSTERSPTLAFDSPGTYDVLLRVANADGRGLVLKKLRREFVTVDPASVDFTLSATTGEGRTPITLTATATGFSFPDAAEFEWRWETGGEMTGVAKATGNPATGEFLPGTWNVQLIVANADGAGLAFTNTVAGAVTIAAGADYYVKANGSDEEGDGTRQNPYKSLAKAVAEADASGIEGVKKIKVSGMSICNAAMTLADIELYGDGPAGNGVVTADNNSGLALSLKGRTSVHGLKIGGARIDGGVLRVAATETDVVVSNCWITGNWFTTGGTPAGTFAAGLVTHCLFTGNRNNNSSSAVLTLSGTAKVRSSIFTGNYLNSNARGPLNGVLELSGAAELENCVVVGNWAKASADGDAFRDTNRARNGGGLYVSGGTPVVRNCIVRDNTRPPAYDSGAADIYSASEPGDYYALAGTHPVIENCNFTDGQVPVGATGCQTCDPLFVDAGNTSPENRDFSLRDGSSAVNAGKFSAWQREATDYSGLVPRFQGAGVDIGAHEKAEPTPVVDITASQASGFDEITVTLAAVNVAEGASIPEDADCEWTINGVRQEARTRTLELTLGVGTYSVGVIVMDVFAANKPNFITVRHTPGIEFESEVVATLAGTKRVSFKSRAVGDMTFDAGTTYRWLRQTPGGDWSEFATAAHPQDVSFGPGVWTVKVVASNVDGSGGSVEKTHSDEVTVLPADIAFGFGTVRATGSKTVSLVVRPVNFAFAADAVFKWFWTSDGSGAADATGNPAFSTFGEGTYSVRVKVTNADGAGASFEKTFENAIQIEHQTELVLPEPAGWRINNRKLRAYEAQFRTVNGQSIFGEGDIVVAGESEERPFADVTEYGAAGDGTTDDSGAFAAAVAAAKASGRTIRVSGNRTYYLAKTVALDGVSLAADLAAKIVASASPALLVSGDGVTVRNLVIEPTGDGISVNGAANALLDRVLVNGGEGRAVAISASAGVTVRDSIVRGAATGVEVGAGASGVAVIANVLNACTDYGIRLSAAVPSLRVAVNEIDNCRIGIGGVAGGVISGNSVSHVSEDTAWILERGVDLEGGADLVLQGNQFSIYKDTRVPIRLRNVERAVVADNLTSADMTTQKSYDMTAGFMELDGLTNAVVTANAANVTAANVTGTAATDVSIVVRNSRNVELRCNNLVGGAVKIGENNVNVTKDANVEEEVR